MGEIEWRDEQVLEPAGLPAREFWRRKRLAWPPPADGPAPLVFVSDETLKGLNDHLANDKSREHGGVLVGLPYRDPQTGETYVDIHTAIPAQDSQGTAMHLQFTAEAWAWISGIMEDAYPDLVIVGWYHSHPGLGVFMSGTDQASHRAFYNQPWSLALVVDPVAGKAGWFRGTECTRLQPGQVVIYKVHEPVAREEPFKKLRWFLPLALFGLAALVGYWLLITRDRL